MYTQLRLSLVFDATFPNIFVNCGNHCYSSQVAGSSQSQLRWVFLSKFWTKIKFPFFFICFDLLSGKMCKLGVHQFVSISAAWAHVELAMLLKNVRLLLVGLYLIFGKIFLACLSGWCVCQSGSMGPYGAPHAPKTDQSPELTVPLTFLASKKKITLDKVGVCGLKISMKICLKWTQRFPLLNLSTSKSKLGVPEVVSARVQQRHLSMCDRWHISMGPYGAHHASKKG